MIETTGLSKVYGDTHALDGVDLNVPAGAVYGLVGPNGAGKTTLLGILAGLRRATTGAVAIATTRVGVLPDTPLFDSWLTGREVVDLALFMTTGEHDEDRVTTMLDDAGIGEAADRAVGGYSRGMLQRLGIAASLVADPELVLLDEPCSALDPLGRREVLDLIARMRGSATVVFSSHILADVQEVCDTVGILRQGRLVFEGGLHELLVGKAQPRYVVRLRPPLEPVVASLAAADWIDDVEMVGPEQIRVGAGNLDLLETRLLPALTAADAHVVSLSPEAPSLEDVFLEVVS
ncbi:MAG: ABC transporter ATP-binding protein [Acidimicrobiia bacterium]|nr:ABC transporter ATP-binding protein [Acidimicrobiia bacterium]